MLFFLFCSSFLNAETVPMQNESIISTLAKVYKSDIQFVNNYLQKNSLMDISQPTRFFRNKKTITEKESNKKYPKSIIQSVLHNNFYLQPDCLEYKVNNQSIRHEVEFIKYIYNAIEKQSVKNKVLVKLRNYLQRVILQINLNLLSKNMDSLTKSMGFVSIALDDIVKYFSEMDYLYSSKLNKNSTKTEITEYYMQYSSSSVNYNGNPDKIRSKSPVDKNTSSLLLLNKIMEKTLISFYKKFGITPNVMDLSYKYFSLINVLYAIENLVSTLRLIAKNNEAYSKRHLTVPTDYKHKSNILLFNALRRCNVCIFVVVIDIAQFKDENDY